MPTKLKENVIEGQVKVIPNASADTAVIVRPVQNRLKELHDPSKKPVTFLDASDELGLQTVRTTINRLSRVGDTAQSWSVKQLDNLHVMLAEPTDIYKAVGIGVETKELLESALNFRKQSLRGTDQALPEDLQLTDFAGMQIALEDLADFMGTVEALPAVADITAATKVMQAAAQMEIQRRIYSQLVEASYAKGKQQAEIDIQIDKAAYTARLRQFEGKLAEANAQLWGTRIGAYGSNTSTAVVNVATNTLVGVAKAPIIIVEKVGEKVGEMNAKNPKSGIANTLALGALVSTPFTGIFGPAAAGAFFLVGNAWKGYEDYQKGKAAEKAKQG